MEPPPAMGWIRARRKRNKRKPCEKDLCLCRTPCKRIETRAELCARMNVLKKWRKYLRSSRGNGYGEGRPIVLLQGAFMTIEASWGQLTPELPKTKINCHWMAGTWAPLFL